MDVVLELFLSGQINIVCSEIWSADPCFSSFGDGFLILGAGVPTLGRGLRFGSRALLPYFGNWIPRGLFH